MFSNSRGQTLFNHSRAVAKVALALAQKNGIEDKQMLRLTLRTRVRIETFRFAGTRAQSYKQIGNGVAMPVGEWAGREVVRYFGKSSMSARK